VIYQTDNDFNILPEELRWRHVRYEPAGDQAIDFTWEREWRMHCDEWASALRRSHDAAQGTIGEL